MKVITYQAPNGETVDLAEKQVAALGNSHVWPRNASGEYSGVYRGLHVGFPTWRSIDDLMAYAHDPGRARLDFLAAKDRIGQ